MAKKYTIEEREDAYRAHFFSAASDDILYKFPTCQVRYGWIRGLPVAKWCDYYKAYYTREEAEEYASRQEDCSQFKKTEPLKV